MPHGQPQRSCIHCRTVHDKSDLLRFVLAPDRTLVPDLLAKLPGRGAYTCLKVECVRNAAARKQFSRAFKGDVNGGDAGTLIAMIGTKFHERIAGYLGLANKAGKVVSGTDSIEQQFARQKPGLMLVAVNAADDTASRLEHLADRSGVEHFRIFEKEQMGALLGKGVRTAVLIQPSGFSESISKELKRYRNFFEGGISAT
jgi:predicted RNA-binding protein YlxR (DUF448 family)/ribosomal protein L7Ae-like RNA K-turn-binding protein